MSSYKTQNQTTPQITMFQETSSPIAQCLCCIIFLLCCASLPLMMMDMQNGTQYAMSSVILMSSLSCILCSTGITSSTNSSEHV